MRQRARFATTQDPHTPSEDNERAQQPDARVDDQGDNSLTLERQLVLWQGELAREAQQGNGIDALHRVLCELKKNFGTDEAFLLPAISELKQCADRQLSESHEPELINAIFAAIFPDLNSDLDDAAIKIDAANEIKRLAKLPPIEYERQRKEAAKGLGIDRLSVLDSAVKAARAANGDTKGQGRPLELPLIEPWPEAINGADLLDDICDAVKRYLVLPDGSAEALALWAVHTHAFECFTHSPRLAITSPEKQCGKTTTLDVLGELVARPLSTSNATTAAIFRTIEKAKPTLLIDEADTFLGENEELRGVLNAGHRRGGQIIRTVGDDHEPRQFSTFTPAAIAMIGRLPDTLEDRSVSIALRRRRPTEKVQQFRSDRVQDLKQLSRKIARWCDDNRQNLAASDPNTGALANRAADNWRPLLSVADLAGGRWPEHARAVAQAAETAKQDQSKRTMVLGDIRDIFAARSETDRLRSAEMAEVLGAMENRPWSEWRNGKPITPAALARLLAPFGITPGTKRDGESTFKGYLLSDFTEAFATYLPDQTVTPSQPNNDGHRDDLRSVTPESDVTVSKASQPNNHGLCDGVTFSSPPFRHVPQCTDFDPPSLATPRHLLRHVIGLCDGMCNQSN
jgi:putative DNA primase/helicase